MIKAKLFSLIDNYMTNYYDYDLEELIWSTNLPAKLHPIVLYMTHKIDLNEH